MKYNIQILNIKPLSSYSGFIPIIGLTSTIPDLLEPIKSVFIWYDFQDDILVDYDI